MGDNQKMETKMQITIQALTPIWTGGMNGTMHRIHETGIIGGLRWWYEAMLRALGVKVCDPLSRENGQGCQFDANDSRSPEEQLCAACLLFGCTGWRRRFQLRVNGAGKPAWSPPPRGLNVRPPDRNRGWFLLPGHVGEATLNFIGDSDALNDIGVLLLFLEQWGTIGAKPQLGYGVFRIRDDQERERLSRHAENFQNPRGETRKTTALPDLRDIAFFRFDFSPSGKNWWSRVSGLERLMGQGDTARALSRLTALNMIPVAPALKNAWRYGAWERIPAEREVFGTTSHDRIRSKIAVSWAYKTPDAWRVRGWAWLPSSLPKQARGAVMERIENKTVWRKILNAPMGDARLTAGLDALGQLKGA